MGPLAPALVASLVQLAAFDADLGARLDSMTSTEDAERDLENTRTSLSAQPSVTGIADTSELRLGLGYSPRFWTSDVEAQRSVLVSHELQLRAVTSETHAWRVEATATGARGRTDPLLDAARTATPPTVTQVATTESLRTEEVSAGLTGEVPIGERTTLGGAARFQYSHALDASSDLLPMQRGFFGDASFRRRVTERDTIGVSASVGRTITDRASSAPSRSVLSTSLFTWRRRLDPHVEGWTGAGASFLYEDHRDVDLRYDLQPSAVIGVSRGGEGLSTTVDAEARLATAVDRLTGEMVPWIDARIGFGWIATDRLLFAASASGGGRTDGANQIAAATARMSWNVYELVVLELGISARGQRDRDAARPTFVELGVFASLVYSQPRIFGGTPDRRERSFGAPPDRVRPGTPGADAPAGGAPGAVTR